MSKSPLARGVALAALGTSLTLPTISQAAFIEDSKASVELRNFYMNRDFRQEGGSKGQSKAEEWAQGFLLRYESGYTEGTVGFGVDAIGTLGLKLDSGGGTSGTGLLQRDRESGEAQDSYGDLGVTAKVKLSNSVLKAGTLMPKLPVLMSNDSRLLPQSFQGGWVNSQEITGLTLDAGQLSRVNQRDSSDHETMLMTTGTGRGFTGTDAVDSDEFNFAGASYSAEWLRLRTDLIGKLLWLHIDDENDARVATVSSQRGEYLGTVRAAPPWHRSPHTLYMRRAIRALDKNRRLHLSTQCDAVEELIRYAESSEGKKLAPHPAYLEARRVLQQYAEQLAGEPMVARVRDRMQQRAPDCPAPETDATTPNPPPTTARSSEPAHKSKRETREQTPKQAMPRMKMAKVW